MQEIQLTKGRVTIVDDEDYDWLTTWKWCTSQGYAARSVASDHVDVIYMHRLLLAAPPKMVVDHINLDKLDNRRSNLRLCTRSQNCYNRPASKSSRSGVKGVFWDNEKGKWLSQICVSGKRIHIGRFNSMEEAARAYNDAARDVFGQYAYINPLEVSP